jgi:DNA repair exonuclease SbcCD ATPase subunit
MTTATKFTKATIKIRLNNQQFQELEGYTFEHEGIVLGVTNTSTGWHVTDVTTGMSVGKFKMPSRKAAVTNAITEIDRVTAEVYKAKVEELLKPGKLESESKRQAEAQAKKQAETYEKALDEVIEEVKTMTEKDEYKSDNEKAHEEYKRKLEEQANLKKAQEQAEARAKQEAEAKAKLKAEEAAAKAEQAAKPKKSWNIGQFFKNIASLEELKKAYKKFTKWLHPDVSDYENADEAFKALQKQYEQAEKLIAQGKTVEAEQINVDISEFLKNAINNISHLEGIEIKIKGTWVWVAGVERENTAYHDVLKANGFRFGGKALEWYLADETAGAKKRRGRGYSADQITEKFGEVKVKEGFKKQPKKSLTSQVAESKKGYKKGK